MSERPPEHRPGLTRRGLLQAAGGAAAAAGLATLPGCGESDEAAQTAVAGANVDAPQLRSYPFIPSQAPLNCQLLSFFTPDEARAVEAFTARLIPGTPADPGAREACVTNYIDRKLAEHASFATPTYFRPPFAKAAEGRVPGFAGDTVYVSEEDLPRYGFQSDLTPQQAYRQGLAELEKYATTRYRMPFAGLREDVQDTILGLLENDKIESFRKPGGQAFFSMLQDDANEGMFADPIYGGNRDFAGWKLIGYPGAQRAYTPAELKDGPLERTIQGLREMQAMHPGRVQSHVILPIQGTRRTGG
ncbi:MAG TPA: gluconate 2-dehydrogenase subunit 3 family protein [Gaiellaceae bacterium]|nr:gluconate 2-dehydrogenase subunit 3 family protein [Gaiellaceae bacterium]